MPKIITLVGLLMLWAVPATAQPVNEWTIVDDVNPKIHYIASGIAYNDGTWKESDASIDYSNPTKWENLETPTPWEINTSNLTLSIGRHGDTKSTIRPDGIFWLNTTTWAVTEAVGWAVPVVTENPTSVFLDGMLNAGDGDAELISRVDGITWDYVFNSTAGWTANPYPAGESALVVRYQMGKNHNITVDGGQAVDWNGTVANDIVFETAGAVFDIASVEATDATDTKYDIVYYLRNAQGNDWFMEGISATDFASATLPLRYHYDSVSGNIITPTTWTTGTTYIIPSVTRVRTALTVEPGVCIKFNQPQAVVNFNFGHPDCELASSGTTESPIIATACRDNTWDGAGCEDTSAYCTTDTPTAGDPAYGSPNALGVGSGHVINISGSTNDITHEVNFVGWVHSYCGSSAPCFNGGSGIQGMNLTLDNNYFMPTNVTDDRIFDIPSAGIGVRNEITIQNSYFDTTNHTTWAIFIINNQEAGSFNRLYNNIFAGATGETGISGIFWTPSPTAGNDKFMYNTMDCGGDSGSTAVDDASDGNIDYYYNIFSNCKQILGGNVGRNNYNIVYNVTDGTEWTDGANSITSDPAYASHDDSLQTSTFDAFHLGSASPAIDMADITSASVSYDTLHTEDSGYYDTGQLDVGFHFEGGEEDPGGSAPPAGGGPPTWGGSGPHGSGYDANGNPRWGWGLTRWGKTQGRW